MLKELDELHDEEYDMLIADMLGYGIYSIPDGRVALADTIQHDGLYIEGSIAEVLSALDKELEAQQVPAITNYAEAEA
jgi:hypothetical protein